MNTPPLDPNESDPYILWAEIHRLNSLLKGPDGFDTWMDAAVHERRAKIAAERKLQDVYTKVESLLDYLN